MPLFPFRVNISKLQEQDVMKKFTACTFPQDIIASSRWSAIHVHAHTHTQTHTLHRQRYQTLRCSPKHVRSLVWQKEEEWINQPAEKGRQTPLSSACTAGTTQFIPQDSWEIKIQLAQSGPSHLHLPLLPRPPHLTIIFWHEGFRGHLLFSMLSSRSAQATAKPAQILGGNGYP